MFPRRCYHEYMMKSQHATQLPTLGFVGLGNMGSRMARNLLNAGYPLIGYDSVSEKREALVTAGALAANNAADVAKQSDVVLTSLRSSDVFVDIAENAFLPHARNGHIFIDMGTTEASETRRLAAAFAEKGATLIDAPVSGGPHGSETGTLRIFVGGEAAAVEKCRQLLEILGESQHVVYCGPRGAGQIVKGVNQVAMGLGAAAFMEAMAYGVRAGIEPTAIRQAIGMGDGWRGQFDSIAKQILDGKGNTLVVKYPELPYFLAEAAAAGFEMPLTQALYEFCQKGDYEMLDNMNRASRSFWHELTKQG